MSPQSSASQPTQAPYLRRVLAFDGGPAALLHARMLDSILSDEDLRDARHVLERTHVFAGTSSGGQVALFLAKQVTDGVPGKIALRNCVAFTNALIRAWRTVPFLSAARFAAGVWPLITNDRLRQVLERHFKNMTLRDLKPKVVIVSMDEQMQTSRIFTNIAHREGHSNRVTISNARLVDVALASSAFPLLQPMHAFGRSRYLDGGFVANNPTMIALARTLNEASEDGTELPEVPDRLAGLRVLSLGATYQRQQEASPAGFSPLAWAISLSTLLSKSQRQDIAVNRGWFGWLVSPPIHLLNLMFQASANEVDFQCRRMLEVGGKPIYQRVVTPLPQMNILTGILARREAAVINLLNDLSRQLMSERMQIAQFLNEHWTDDEPQRQEAGDSA